MHVRESRGAKIALNIFLHVCLQGILQYLSKEIMPLYKLWNCTRTIEKSVVANSLEELVKKGKQKYFTNSCLIMAVKESAHVIQIVFVPDFLGNIRLVYLRYEQQPAFLYSLQQTRAIGRHSNLSKKKFGSLNY